MNTLSSKNAFFNASLIGIFFTNTLILSVASPLRSYQVLVWNHCPTTFAVLDGDDNCMLSVPFSTSDLHLSCWQSSANCHAMAAEAFMMLNYALWLLPEADVPLLFCLAVLLTCYLLHDSRLLGLTLRPSAPVCCCHRVSWARGRPALAQGSRALSSFSFSSIGSACDGMCPVVSSSL